MSFSESMRSHLSLPAVCPPMFMVSTPELVSAACLTGIIGGLPRHNVRTIVEFETWLKRINEVTSQRRATDPNARIAPLAVNLDSEMSSQDISGTAAFRISRSLYHRSICVTN